MRGSLDETNYKVLWYPVSVNAIIACYSLLTEHYIISRFYLFWSILTRDINFKGLGSSLGSNKDMGIHKHPRSRRMQSFKKIVPYVKDFPEPCPGIPETSPELPDFRGTTQTTPDFSAWEYPDHCNCLRLLWDYLNFPEASPRSTLNSPRLLRIPWNTYFPRDFFRNTQASSIFLHSCVLSEIYLDLSGTLRTSLGLAHWAGAT